MGIYSNATPFLERVIAAKTADDLAQTLALMCHALGFHYYALSHHVDVRHAGAKAIRLHNYPSGWADYYDANALGVSDPVHRASHVTSIGFKWSQIPTMIRLTRQDRRVLSLGNEQGIGDGFTVPANVPGEARGSCSFANEAGRELPADMLPMAHLVGAFAFEAARHIWTVRTQGVPPPSLTDRQRDCALWAGRGKGDWEIGRILDVSEETVAQHIKQGCERYGVNKRSLLLIRTLYDGTLTFEDLISE
jgi:LuxR family quorum-sensing system transcriptional regulator CciR